MNTLHTFGCSFTAPYSTNIRVEYRKYFNYKGNKFPDIWPVILSQRIGFNLNNKGKPGASNYEIFSDFCGEVNNFKRGDIVIIGWSFKERFRLVNDKQNSFVRILPNSKQKLNNISKNTIDEIYANRGNIQWAYEVITWESLIKKTLEMMEIKLIIWSFDDSFPNDTFILDKLKDLGAKTIEEETNGIIQDQHMGEFGHIVQSNYFYNILRNSNKIINNNKII